MFYRQKTHSVYYSHALGGKKKIENCFMMPTLSDYVGVSRIQHQFPGLPNGSPNLLQTEFWAFLCFFGFLICVLSAVPAVPAPPTLNPSGFAIPDYSFKSSHILMCICCLQNCNQGDSVAKWSARQVTICQSWVRVPLWQIAGFVPGRPELKSSASVVNSQLVASCHFRFLFLLCCILCGVPVN